MGMLLDVTHHGSTERKYLDVDGGQRAALPGLQITGWKLDVGEDGLVRGAAEFIQSTQDLGMGTVNIPDQTSREVRILQDVVEEPIIVRGDGGHSSMVLLPPFPESCWCVWRRRLWHESQAAVWAVGGWGLIEMGKAVGVIWAT